MSGVPEPVPAADRRPAIGERRRGELRVYLGAAPGVGKTYAMLAEAHRRRAEGVDVVVGVVEDHGRAETAALVRGLEVIPPRIYGHRGTELRELDVDAVLRRAPEAVLVDELAHTDAPGAPRSHRHKDVELLLEAGIDVLTTLNIQHLESLNDVVGSITGTVQRETVPDDVVRTADEIELVDLPPSKLQGRLRSGRLYKPDCIDAALGNYFRLGNLTALRELALLWLADRVDEALAVYRDDKHITDTWEARERVVVAVTGGPESTTLLRRARRIASRSSAELLAVHVIRGDGLVTDPGTDMPGVRRLALTLGATMHSVVGEDVPRALLEFARAVNATQLVIGTSRRSRFSRLLDEGIGAAVLRDSGRIDVHMVTHHELRPDRRDRPRPGTRRVLRYLLAVLAPLAASGLAQLWDDFLGDGATSALYFLTVLGVSLVVGLRPAVISAVISGVLLNYLFTVPRYSLTVAEPSNAVSLIAMLLVAVAVAVLVDRARRRALEARAAGRDAEVLSLFARSVLRDGSLPALLEKLRMVFGLRAVVAVVDEMVVGLATEPAGEFAATSARTLPDVGARVGADVEAEADTVCRAADGSCALLLWGRAPAGRDQASLGVVAAQAAGLVRQDRLAAEAAQASALAAADRLRRALLAAVGHDLRTPLATAKLSVSSLRSTDVVFSEADRAELLETTEDSIDQLTGLVSNLLDSSRLAAGVVRPTLRPVAVEEIVQRAIAYSQGARQLGLSRVEVQVGGAVVLADAGLLERVLANLIDNACRHAGEGPVRVEATEAAGAEADRVAVAVVDRGPGIPCDMREQAFWPFQRMGDTDRSSGVGLGLSVARGFTEAMDGSIEVLDTPGGGATVVVELADGRVGREDV